MVKDKRLYIDFPLKRLWKQGLFALSLQPVRCLLVRQFRGYGTILAGDLILFFKLQTECNNGRPLLEEDFPEAYREVVNALVPVPQHPMLGAGTCRTDTSGEEAKESLGDQFSGLWFIPSVAPFTTMGLLTNITKQNKIQVVDAGSNHASTSLFFHLATTYF